MGLGDHQWHFIHSFKRRKPMQTMWAFTTPPDRSTIFGCA
jgi:hypothetical protein